MSTCTTYVIYVDRYSAHRISTRYRVNPNLDPNRCGHYQGQACCCSQGSRGDLYVHKLVPNMDRDVYKMYEPKTNKIYQTHDIIWLRRMFYTGPDA